MLRAGLQNLRWRQQPSRAFFLLWRHCPVCKGRCDSGTRLAWQQMAMEQLSSVAAQWEACLSWSRLLVRNISLRGPRFPQLPGSVTFRRPGGCDVPNGLAALSKAPQSY